MLQELGDRIAWFEKHGKLLEAQRIKMRTEYDLEMMEEMGLAVGVMRRIGSFLLTPGGADEVCELFAGRVQAPDAAADGIAGHAGMAEEHEDIRVRVWPADRAIEAALGGQMTNSVTTIGLLWLAARREVLRKEWMAA